MCNLRNLCILDEVDNDIKHLPQKMLKNNSGFIILINSVNIELSGIIKSLNRAWK